MDGRRLAASLICATILLASPRWSEAADCIVAVVDGDSLRVRTACLPPPPALTLARIAGIDAPELRGKCAQERRQARAAQAFVRDAIDRAESVEIRSVGREKFGRELVEVFVDYVNLADSLVAAGLARRYDGRGKRLPWCLPAAP